MRRRTLLMSAGAAALGLANAAVPAAAQDVRTLRFGTALPADSPPGAGARVFESEIRRRTGGRFRTEYFPDGMLGSESAMLKDLQQGRLDMAFITGAVLPEVVVETGAFSLPFIFDGVAHARDMLDGPIGQGCLARFRDSNLVALAWGENGLRHMTSATRPIRTPDDLKGVKFGVPQSVSAVIGFETLGANVSPVALPELYGALESGRLDGQESPIATIQATKIWRVQKYLTLSGHIYDPAVILMSPKVFDALSPEDQAAFAEVATLAALASRRHAAGSQTEGIELLSQAGMEVVRTIDRARFIAALQPAQPRFEAMFGAGLVGWIRDQNIA
ncbi:TRAP transporter substrate-binding protein DctP [Rhodopila globiformis]|nr:TRAP transporter substrate-binding protein DctP [Rhodopila globiformis]